MAPNNATTMVYSHNGHVNSMKRKLNRTSSVFWMMKISRTPSR